jgi:hypothetical protein
MHKNTLADLRESVRAAPEKMLMMSRLNCHAQNLSSIVIDTTTEGLIRAFLAWPGHPLKNNGIQDGQSLQLGIHNHRYDLSFYHINGNVIHDVYDRGNSGRSLYHHRFPSQLKGNRRPPYCLPLPRTLELFISVPISSFQFVVVPHCQLHTIRCDDFSAWIVREGGLQEGYGPIEETDCYNTSRHIHIPDHFYRPFTSPKAVVDHVEQFCEAAGDISYEV